MVNDLIIQDIRLTWQYDKYLFLLLQFNDFQKKSVQMVKPAKGTTTLAFIYKDGVMVAADLRASMGGYICMHYLIAKMFITSFSFELILLLSHKHM